MNKNLEDLYEQSRIGQSFGHCPEKFAELIIKNCCKMMVDLEIKYAVNLTVREIKQHFGIKK